MKQGYVIKCGELYAALNDKRWGWTVRSAAAQVFESYEAAARSAAIFNDGVTVEPV